MREVPLYLLILAGNVMPTIGTSLRTHLGRHSGVTLHTCVMPTWGVSREKKAHFLEGEDVISFLHLFLLGSAAPSVKRVGTRAGCPDLLTCGFQVMSLGDKGCHNLIVEARNLRSTRISKWRPGRTCEAFESPEPVQLLNLLNQRINPGGIFEAIKSTILEIGIA
ncbi:hypothetical protein T484DRAFT_2656777 [Baffinella frigidus]|nr:hypothetical protein T484DRAFT_2656777 [Cryptophyta sp. CCMP2293]